MRFLSRAAAAAAATVVFVPIVGCSTKTGPVDASLWRQLDAAENAIYEVLTSPTVTPSDPAELLDRLSVVANPWDREADADYFSDGEGTAVFYDFRESPRDTSATFDVFVASGVAENSSPSRVYTCYRIDVAFSAGGLEDFHRSHDYSDDLLTCPTPLVDALGHGAQYREPSIFDG